MVFHHPAAIWAAAGIERLQFRVFHEPVIDKVDPKNGAGAEAAAACDCFRRNVEYACFGGEHEKTVFRQRPARGSEPVAVERRTESDAIGECDGGRAIPRFHKCGVVFVERSHVVAHVVFRAPRLRNQHHHRVRGVASGGDKQLEYVVERCRVRLAGMDDWQELLQFVAEERRGERRLAGRERVQVAFDGVDFAVVRDCAERVGELPRWERVRRIALVHDRERRDEIRIREVWVELLNLRREKKPLIDNRPRRA